MANIVNKINKNPIFFKKILFNLIPFHHRYGKEFKSTLDEIIGTEKLSYEQLRQIQFDKLKETLVFSYENTQYYKELFDKINFNPYEFKDFSEMKKIPILTKELVRENFEKLINKNIDKTKIKIIKTSGSTGEPLKIAITDDVYKKEAAFISRSYLKHDCRMYYEKEIKLRSYVPKDEKKFEIDYELKRMYMSPFHINEENIGEYVKQMDKFGARFISAYASSAYIFSLMCEKTGVKPKNIKYIHTTSEKLPIEWKQHIEKILDVKVFSHYGMVEKVCHFYQCDKCDGYHQSMEYGYTEFEQDWSTLQGSRNKPKIYANMIATGFINKAMPLIRYQLTDMALFQYDDEEKYGINKLVNNNVCGIGSPVHVQDFIGRTGDFLLSDNGSKIPPVNFYTLMCKEVIGVKMFQIIQKTDIIKISIVPDNFEIKYLNTLKTDVVSGMEKRLGKNNYEILFVDAIKRDEKTNKIRTIINEVN